MTDYKRFGYKGEDLAADFLRRKGYDIVAVNYATSFGEIDIVARYKGTTIFVEVKSRRSERFGVPAEAVHYRKRKKIVKTAQCWLQQYKENDRPCRFDVIEILKTKPSYDIRHITHAFIMEC